MATVMMMLMMRALRMQTDRVPLEKKERTYPTTGEGAANRSDWTLVPQHGACQACGLCCWVHTLFYVVRYKHGLNHVLHIQLRCIKITFGTCFIPCPFLLHELPIHLTGERNHTNGMPCPMIIVNGKALLPRSTRATAKVVKAHTVPSLRDQFCQLPCNPPTSLY